MSEDTGRRLRSLYEPQGGVEAIFSSKVSDYSASRPGYPAILFETLRHDCRLDRDSLIVDVGAGTGLLARGFLERGHRVIAVEPNADMRRMCDRSLMGYTRAEGTLYSSVEGRAEAMPIETGTVDLVTAAQAFHWFDVARARVEFQRVLRESGRVALIRNNRIATDPLQAAIEEACADYGGERRKARLSHDDWEGLSDFLGTGTAVEYTWPHAQLLDRDGLVSLVLSRSYMPERDSPAGREVVARIGRLFEDHAVDARVIVRYVTVAIVGRPL